MNPRLALSNELDEEWVRVHSGQRPTSRRKREQWDGPTHLSNAIQRDQADSHRGEADEYGVSAADAESDDSGWQGSKYAANGPGDKSYRYILWSNTEAFGAMIAESVADEWRNKRA